MEKLAYQLWKKDDDSLETFKELLLKNLSKDIGELVSELQINIADADVLPANNLAQSKLSTRTKCNNIHKSKKLFFSQYT
jgi:hypothetical protein